MQERLMQLRELCDRYREIDSGLLSPDLTEGGVLEEMRARTAKLIAWRKESTELLEGRVYPMLDELEQIDDALEADLFATAQKLSAYTVRIDSGLALKIYEALLARARALERGDLILKYLYWCGITCYYVDHRLLADRAYAYFAEGADYDARYEQLPDAQTRAYVHRCLGNCSMMLHGMDRHEEAYAAEVRALSFWNRVMFIGMDEDLPWTAYFLSVLNHRHSYACRDLRSHPTEAARERLARNLSNTMALNRLHHANPGQSTPHGETRYDFVLWEARFLSGLISYQQLCENVVKCQNELSPDDFSNNALYVRVQLTSFLLHYGNHFLPDGAEKKAFLNEMTRGVFDFMSSIPATADPGIVGSHLLLLANNMTDVYSPLEHMRLVLKLTTHRHIPTYAHSIMVGEVAACLVRALMERHPEAFIGLPGIAGEPDARAKREELIAFVRLAGLCHDVGKIEFVHNPSYYTRRLTDAENTVLRNHPVSGKKLLSRLSDDPETEGIVDIILGHHRHFDGTGGYPEDFDARASRYRLLIEVISVADAVDAGTDSAGKSYAPAVSLEEIARQIQEGAGTKYAPLIASLLKEKDVLANLSELITDGRRRAYYQAYLESRKS